MSVSFLASRHQHLLHSSLLALLVFCSGAHAVDRMPLDEHEGHHIPPAALMLDNGKRWNTDAPLRSGMNGIRNAVANTYRTGNRDLTKAEALKLAETIENQFSYMVAYCTLKPQADGVLHLLLAQLLEGASALKKNPADAKARAQILDALKKYPVYFDHPGWQPVPAA